MPAPLTYAQDERRTPAPTYIDAAQARAQGLLAGREARCSCGRTCPSDGSAPGFKDIPFFEYWGPGSKKATEQCGRCGYFRVAHTAEVRARNAALNCGAFEAREPDKFDSFYCGCRGWD